jgi:membrane protease YdiL (CAAX protease family)
MSLFSLTDSASLWLNLTYLAIILLTLLLAWLTHRSYVLLKEFQPTFNLLLSPFEFIGRLALVAICLLLAWLSGLPADQLGLSSANPLRTMGLGLAIGIIVNGLTGWAIHRFGRQIYSPVVIRNILPRHPSEWIWVVLALVPAVGMEELLFRTLWLGVFGAMVPNVVLVFITSVIFGFMHQPQGLLGMLVAGTINILFSILFIGSGELLLPFTAHYVINLLQLIVAYRQREWLENY